VTEVFFNFYTDSLADMCGTGDSTITVNDATPLATFQDGDTFRLLIDAEILVGTDVVGNVITVLRGQEGTTAAIHFAEAPVTNILTAGALTQLKADLQDQLVFTTTLTGPNQSQTFDFSVAPGLLTPAIVGEAEVIATSGETEVVGQSYITAGQAAWSNVGGTVTLIPQVVGLPFIAQAASMANTGVRPATNGTDAQVIVATNSTIDPTTEVKFTVTVNFGVGLGAEVDGIVSLIGDVVATGPGSGVSATVVSASGSAGVFAVTAPQVNNQIGANLGPVTKQFTFDTTGATPGSVSFPIPSNSTGLVTVIITAYNATDGGNQTWSGKVMNQGGTMTVITAFAGVDSWGGSTGATSWTGVVSNTGADIVVTGTASSGAGTVIWEVCLQYVSSGS
jgi:hypothetical protein